SVDAVHDLLEGKCDTTAALARIRVAFVDGGAGVWEQAGSWLRQLGNEQETKELWRFLASEKSAKTRFRVACFLNDLDADLRTELASALMTDRSRKVAEMAKAKFDEPQL
ncbi:unnamed protein product, partial [Ectocarpus sp. 4 AP-2014]